MAKVFVRHSNYQDFDESLNIGVLFYVFASASQNAATLLDLNDCLEIFLAYLLSGDKTSSQALNCNNHLPRTYTFLLYI